METQAEKRARLRQAKILSNSQARLNKIISGQLAVSKCDDDDDDNTSLGVIHSQSKLQNPTSRSFTSKQNINSRASTGSQQSSLDDPSSENTTTSSSTSSCSVEPSSIRPELPPRDESFPRKVSLINSPIHYKTLQQSQRFNQQDRMSNLQSRLLGWSGGCQQSVLLLVILSCLGSYLTINFMAMFTTFQSVQYLFLQSCLFRTATTNNMVPSIGQGPLGPGANNLRTIATNVFTIDKLFKELLLSIFCYVITQVFFKISIKS